MVARVEVDYRRPILLGESVEVACWPTAIGRSSFTLDYRVEANGELAAEGRSVQVHLENGRPAAVPEATRAGLEALMEPDSP